MVVRLVPQQGELSVQIDFTDPSFELFTNPAALARSLFKQLSSYGVRISDLKFQPGDPSYADLQLSSSIFSLLAEVRVRPDRVDVRTFETSKRSEMFAVMASAAAAVAEHATDVTFRSFGSTAAFHGMLREKKTEDYISEFVREAPVSAGTVLSAGIAYYFAPDSTRLMSSITLEPSQAVQGGLYLRSVAVWDAQQHHVTNFQAADEAYFAQMLTAFGIELQ